ncbi:response regulator transcription factor [Nitrosophilus labii]|uniref:response regulator transcription factor n=1 Tax=Nitrosophilus labii TaxID=2706014 RepID=UPI001657301C|nr:response regulator transcription factor [Nitrosophilus labii]
MKIVILEDEAGLSYAIKLLLEANGHTVYNFDTIDMFIKQIDSIKPIDLIILDISLPDGNALKMLKSFPQIKEESKILIISGHTEIENIRTSFELGAEDFIKKPFNPEELLLRVNRIFKLLQKNLQHFGDRYYYDWSARMLYNSYTPVVLSRTETKLLEFLLRNKGRFLSPQTIAEYVWEESVPNNTVAALVNRLRKKLQESNVIVSKREIGYAIL